MSSVPPNPKLGKTTALNQVQNVNTRLNELVPSFTTELSPVTVYQPGGTVGGELLAQTSSPTPVDINTSYGVWVAPDINGDGSTWYATVECFGGGGGAGGGGTAIGGGGGGGGEYACETQYPVTPGASYVYVVGLPGSGGLNNGGTAVNPGTAGTAGGITVFDITGVGLAGGVVANGGQGGDATSIGIGGAGGTGSANTIHFNGGSGGTVTSGNGSDNPISLAQVSGMFVGNTLSTGIIETWHIMNDSNLASATRNDSTLNGRTGTWTNFTGSFVTAELNPTAPSQVPAYTANAGTYGPNQTTAGWTSLFSPLSTNAAAARFAANVPSFQGTKLTVSGWIQAPAAGTWGNTANSSFAVIASNSTNINTSAFKGYALYMFKDTTGTWRCYAQVGNGTTRYAINSNPMPPTPGTWYYVVMTYNSGTLSLYVNGSLVTSTTTTGYTSVPGGAYQSYMGMDPVSNANWFFGAVSNFWWANDCATSTLVTQAFGLSPATGGAGGGASGGPSAVGGNGASSSGATGGAGGTPPVQPSSVASSTTPAMGGFAGANAGSGNSSPITPSGGSYGGGGGGSGDMAVAPATTVITIPFSAAATYAGIDALTGPGMPFNVSQQANPNSGLNTLLYAGGLASDSGSGSKNTVLLLPKGLAATLGSGNWTIQNVFLTITNAFPNNTTESVLEVGYSTTDTVLPQNYQGASLVDYVAAIPIPVGSGTITYDLTSSGFDTQLTGFGGSNVATALILGPGSNPTIDAYNAITGPQFYASIYGPGAYDTAGNPLYPYMTIVLQKTVSVQQGSDGAGAAIVITNVANATTPVATIEPYTTTDGGGNQFAQGFTGPITNFDPDHQTPGQYRPESWKTVAAPTGMTGTFRYKLLSEVSMMIVQVTATITSTLGSAHTYSTSAIDSQYWPANTQSYPCVYNVGVSAPVIDPFITITSSGVISVVCDSGFTNTAIPCTIQNVMLVPLN